MRQGGESWAETARSQGRSGGSGWQGWDIGYNLDAGKGAKNTAGKAVKNPEVPEVSGPTHGF